MVGPLRRAIGWVNLKFDDFASTLKLAQKIGAMADEQWHRPELHVGFGHEVDMDAQINELVGSFIFCASKRNSSNISLSIKYFYFALFLPISQHENFIYTAGFNSIFNKNILQFL